MKIAFNIVMFVFIAVIALAVISMIVSSISGRSLFKGKSSGSSEGILYSGDGGETWKAMNVAVEGDKKDIKGLTLKDLVFDSGDSSSLYLLTERDGLFFSSDQGVTWKIVGGEGNSLEPTASILGMVIKQSDPKVRYLAVLQKEKGEILKSESTDAPFNEVYTATLPGERVTALALDLYDPQTIFAGTSSGLLLVSRDGGSSWSTVQEFKEGIVDIVINPRDTRHIYVMGESGAVSKSIDKGISWDKLGKLPEPQGPSTPGPLFSRSKFQGRVLFGLDPNDPTSHLFMVVGSDVFESRDGGSTFTEIVTIIPTGSPPLHSFAIDPVDSRMVYLGGEGKIYKTVDAGKSWQIKTLPTSAKISRIVIDPSASNRVFVLLAK